MKKQMNKYRLRIKSNLLVKLAKVRRENKYLKERLEEEILKHKSLYDEIKLKDMKIRELTLRLENEKDISKQ